MNKINNISDVVLIERYQKGDVNALNHLVQKWHVHFCKFALWIVKDADVAKDIAQESWSVIIHKLEDLQEPEKFKSWAISIVNRKAIDFLRAQQREQKKRTKHYNETDTEDSSSESDDNSSIKKALLTSVEKLSTEHQIVLRLFYKEDYSLKEISEIVETSVGTVKSRLFHAREKLKTILKQQQYEK
jgi:RNA polymerase sigma-70 factor (ECF subfamily)